MPSKGLNHKRGDCWHRSIVLFCIFSILLFFPSVFAANFVATPPDILHTSPFPTNALFNLKDSDSDGFEDFMNRDSNCDQTGRYCNLHFFYSNGTGFQQAADTSNIGAITTVYRLANTADLTGDGRRDILYHYQSDRGGWGFAIGMNPGAGAKLAWQQTGFWLFSDAQFRALQTPSIFGACDFDGDGNDDVVYINQDVNPVQLYVYRRVAPVTANAFANSWALVVVNIQNPEVVTFPTDRTHQPALICYPATDGLPARLFMVSTYCSAGETRCPAIYQISYNSAANSVSFSPISLPSYSHALPHVVTSSLIPVTTAGKIDLVVSFASDQQNVAVVLPGPILGAAPLVSTFAADGTGTNFGVLGSVLDPTTNRYLLVSALSPKSGGNQFGYSAPTALTQFVQLASDPAASGPIMGTFFAPHLSYLSIAYYSGTNIKARRFCLDQPCAPLSTPAPVSPSAPPVGSCSCNKKIRANPCVLFRGTICIAPSEIAAFHEKKYPSYESSIVCRLIDICESRPRRSSTAL
eukprot:TRINITY_DN997_c0_g1_i1.p1 TRINITY_DN997_c0_g1~~TRINITY_DN997_c0_g1_i1.p1  ORF type:complete len:523 (-),score=84.91 TRINITY_DN997_c0_g1_i1:66-1634(-)